MKLIIARHGRTNFNDANLVSGPYDDAVLTKEGYEHATNLSKVLNNYNIDAIYTSPLRRAYETALPISKQKNITITIDDRITEINPGICQGMPENNLFVKKEREKKYADIGYRISGGESYQDTYQRISNYLNDINKKNLTNVLHVAHHGLNKVLLSHLTNTEIKKMASVNLDNELVYFVDTDLSNVSWKNTKTLEEGNGLLKK
ncbi:MAG: histidine phosphatase family protein [Candidatus Woesearchaeota archaeon]|jgi:probable phosphoglycerate mutase